MKLRIIVTGGREYDDYDRIYAALAEFKDEDVTIIHGGCSGADYLAGNVAEALGYQVEVSAGEEMCESGATYCYAFPGGKGTANCIFLAKRHRIPVVTHK